jgi:two-component system, OmpR family, phosphate regulon sensor histidine kinase PhoR
MQRIALMDSSRSGSIADKVQPEPATPAEAQWVFMRMVSHELRTPLTSITGNVEALLTEEFGELTDEQRRLLEIVQRNSRRILVMADDLLEMTRIQTGHARLQLESVDLTQLVDDELANLRPEFTARQLSVEVHYEPQLPLVWSDRGRAAQILVNLLSNAIKYTLSGGHVTVSLARCVDCPFVHLSVADTGLGIAPADQARIFTPFFRASNASSAGASGAGLGLHITRLIAELQGGEIWFQSELGKGSTFVVTFPTLS